MLAESFGFVLKLGSGGLGETGLFRDLHSGQQVAIKLIKRPLPQLILPNVLQEIAVRRRSCRRLLQRRCNFAGQRAALWEPRQHCACQAQ